MGNAQTTELDWTDTEKGIVITARANEGTAPSSPVNESDSAAHQHNNNDLREREPIGEEFIVTEVPRPPDGGYGWVIVLVSFICNMIVDGIAYSFGIIVSSLVKDFNSDLGTVAWAGSSLNGVYLLTGPIASALTNAYGFRPVCIAGSIIGAASFALSTVVHNVYLLLFVYGVMGGIGIGLIYLPAIVAVNYYFESRRALATGVAVCGSGVGTFLFAPLASLISNSYGWRRVNLIFGAIMLLCVVCGALMKPLVFKKPNIKNKPLLQLLAEEKFREMQRESINSDGFLIVQLPDGSTEPRPKFKMNGDPGVHSMLALDEYGQSSLPLPTISETARTGGSSSPEEGKHQTELDTVETVEETTCTSNVDALNEVSNILESQMFCKRNEAFSADPERSDDDGEKTSDSEKNDIVPELPSEDLDFSRRGSKKTNRRGSAPLNDSAANREGSIVKNTSTPLFDNSRRSSFTIRSGIPGNNSGNSLTVEPYRLSISNRHSVCSWQSDGRSYSIASGSVTPRGSRASIPRAGSMLRPMSRQDIFYSGSVNHLSQFHSERSLSNYKASVLSIARHSSLPNQKDEEIEAGCLSNLCDYSVLRDMLDTSLLKDPIFLLICFSNIMGMLGFYIPFVYLIDCASSKGVPDNSAAFLLSVIGITNTLGRIICGYITDMPRVNALFVSNVCILLSGVSTILFPLCQSYTSFVVVALMFGMFVAGYIALTSVMLVDLMGIERLSNSFGLLILFRGASSMIGSPVAGVLFDITGKYDASFYVAGVLLILASAFGFVVSPVKKILDRRAHDLSPPSPRVSSLVFTGTPSYTDPAEKNADNSCHG